MQPFFYLSAIDEWSYNRYNQSMSNRDDYEKKLETLRAIPDDQIKTPHNVPVEAYIQEAQTLYQWVLEDKDALTAAGPIRI